MLCSIGTRSVYMGFLLLCLFQHAVLGCTMNGVTQMTQQRSLLCTGNLCRNKVIANCDKVYCIGEKACMNTVLTNIQDVMCQDGNFACQNAAMQIRARGTVTCTSTSGSDSFVCDSATIVNAGEVNCLAPTSCDRTIITNTSPETDSIAAKVICSGRSACNGATILGADQVDCVGSGCYGAKIRNAFEGKTNVSCTGSEGGFGACRFASLGVPGTRLGNVVCDGTDACTDIAVHSLCVDCENGGCGDGCRFNDNTRNYCLGAAFCASRSPSSVPSTSPSMSPSSSPSEPPSNAPSTTPSNSPSSVPSGMPSRVPSDQPTPIHIASESPSTKPSTSSAPSQAPSNKPSQAPSISNAPTTVPSEAPSAGSCSPDSPASMASMANCNAGETLLHYVGVLHCIETCKAHPSFHWIFFKLGYECGACPHP